MQTTLLLIAALVCASHALSVPFDPSLVNKTHEVSWPPCGYLRASSSSLTLRPKSLRYVPQIDRDSRGAWYLGYWLCDGHVDLFYRHRPGHMRLEVLPSVRKDFRYSINGPLDDQGPPCSKLQTKRVYWSSGPSRPGFVKEFTKLYNATKELKSAGNDCILRNGSIDTIIAYLHTVAYDYSIPLVV